MLGSSCLAISPFDDDDYFDELSRSSSQQEVMPADEEPDDPTKKTQKLQSVLKLRAYLPYKDKLELTRVELLNKIKLNACTAIVAQGQPLLNWIEACEKYLNTFSLALVKQDHLLLIELCWKAMLQMEHDSVKMARLIRLLCQLLSKPRVLTREDLQLDWRQLYNLQKSMFDSSAVRKNIVYIDPALLTQFPMLVSYSRMYFSAESTGEMLSEWKQDICIYSHKYVKKLQNIVLYLPTKLPQELHNMGWKLWFDDLFELWAQKNESFFEIENLFAGLAKDCIGHIDWEPHMSFLFEMFSKIIMLPSTLSGGNSASCWIVYMIYPGSSCFDHLKQLLKYQVPSYIRIIISPLLNDFMKRLVAERYPIHDEWYVNIPESHRLTDENISEFASLVMEYFPELTTANSFDLNFLHKLSLLCAEMMPQKVLDKLELAQERYFEPNRLPSALHVFSTSVFHLVSNGKVGPEYRVKLIPILDKLIKSINTTDHSLCYANLFAIRSILTLGMPLEDGSQLLKSQTNLNKLQIQFIKQTTSLENFPSEFLDLCFTIIESNNDDLFKVAKMELTLQSLIFDIFTSILSNVSKDKFKILVDKLLRYATTRIFENTYACDVLESLILACIMIDQSGYVLDKFYHAISANILNSIDDKQKYSDICRSEFVYNVDLLISCFADGKALLKYRSDLIALLKRIFSIDYEGNLRQVALITEILSNILNNLTATYPSDYTNLEYSDLGCCVKRYTEWPLQVKLQDLKLKWHSPDQEEIEFARELCSEFIKPQLSTLEQWSTNSESKLSKFELEKCLTIILAFTGLKHCLPSFIQDQDIPNKEKELYFNLQDTFAIELFEGENLHDSLVRLMAKVLVRLEDHPSDNVSILKLIINVFEKVMSSSTMSASSFGAMQSMLNAFMPIGSFSKLGTNAIYSTLSKVDESIPFVQFSRIAEYHLKILKSLKQFSNCQLTESHRICIEHLFRLSTCSSTEIRISAHSILDSVLQVFPQMYELIIPRLLENLRLYETNYEAFKGALYILCSCPDNLLISDNWTTLLKLWPALVEVNFVEKPKVCDLIEKSISSLFQSSYVSSPIEEKLISAQFVQLFNKANGLDNLWKLPCKETIQSLEQSLQQQSATNKQAYEQLLHRLVAILVQENSPRLHWRFYNLGLKLLFTIIRSDVSFPREAMQIILNDIVHESVEIRKTAVGTLKKILFLLKPRKETCTIEVDSNVHFESMPMDCLTSRELYESATFYDKSYIGYYPNTVYTFKKLVSAYQLPEEYNFFSDKFKNEQFLRELFDLYSGDNYAPKITKLLEQMSSLMPGISMGMDSSLLSFSQFSLDIGFVHIWKYLFQMFGLFNKEQIFPRIEKLLNNKKTLSDKLAIDILIGMVKASSGFDYDQVCALKKFLLSIFDAHLNCFEHESKAHWQKLFSTFFTKRDMRRHYWLVEYLLEKLFDPSMTMFYQSAILSFLSTALNSNWKYTQVAETVLSRVEPQFTHEYKLVRESISLVLLKIFNPKIGFFSDKSAISPCETALKCLIDRIVTRLDQSLSPLLVSIQQSQADGGSSVTTIKSTIFDNNTEKGQQLTNYIETICPLFDQCGLSLSLSRRSILLPLLPYLSVIQTSDQAIQKRVMLSLSLISRFVFTEKDIDTLFAYIDSTSINWNWNTRMVAHTLILGLVRTRFFDLKQKPECVARLMEMTIQLLNDEVIEVRQTASKVLKFFIEIGLIGLDEKMKLIQNFKDISTSYGLALTNRHAAIMGLCAFVSAYPRHFPDYLPDVILFLSKHLTDVQMIQKSVNEVLKQFNKTHQDNWIEYKQKFTAEQLAELSVMPTVSSYFS